MAFRGVASRHGRVLPVLLVLAVLAGCVEGGRDGTSDPAGPPGGDTSAADRSDRADPEDARLGIVRDQLDNPLGGQASTEVADALHVGELHLRDGGSIDVTDGVPWGGWEEGGSTSELRLLHSLLFVHDLVATERPEDLELAHELVDDWTERNPRVAPASHMAWHDETTARRTTALIRLHDALERLDATVGLDDRDRERRERLTGAIADHLELLLDDEFHSTGTNHGMFQDRAALLAAGYLAVRGLGGDLTASGWDTARERLVDYYRATVSADGVHLEHAPAYHQLIAASAVREARLLRTFGDDDGADDLIGLHARMAAYATHVVQPDGTWPLVSDTFTRGTPNDRLWDDPGYLFAATGGAEGQAPEHTTIAFEDAGYVIWRDRWGDDGRGSYLHFTAAYHGDYHKHADDLSVWLYHDGPLLTELGPQGYTMDDPLVRCAYSQDAHNIAVVGGIELPRTDDRVGATRLTQVDLDGRPLSATGVNERLDGVRFERQVVIDEEAGVVAVTDRVTTDADRPVRVRWHLDPSVAARVDGTTVELARDGLDPVVGSFTADGRLAVDVLGPDERACTGLRFGGDEPVPTSTVEVTTAPRRETELVSRFELP